MINLLNKLIQNRKKVLRVNRASRGSMTTVQIQKMGQFGQKLVVMSR